MKITLQITGIWVHLGTRAIGGAALVIQEATAVLPEGRITYSDMGLWKDEQIHKLKEIVYFMHERGALSGIQLAHAGRKASCEKPWDGDAQIPSNKPNGWQTVSASDVAFKEDREPPHALDQSEIKNITDAFAAAVKRSKEIGYDVIEIHAAHGYLIHQFYSPSVLDDEIHCPVQYERSKPKDKNW